MNLIFEIAFIFCVLVIISTAQDGYYWRDYMGDLPNDALPGGRDDKGAKVYIGQTVHFAGASVLSGTIRTNQKKLFYEWGNQEYSTIKNVKILCSIYPKRFRWIKTTTGIPIADLTDGALRLIPSGSENSVLFIIGRISITQGDVIGKVNIANDKFDGIWVPDNGRSLFVRSYEVLVYETNINNETEVLCSNKRSLVINLYN